MLGAQLAVAVFLALRAEVNPAPDPGFWIDLANLDWGQGLLVAIGALGLSPAPWLTGLAFGRLQFAGVARKDFERQLGEQAKGYERQLTDKDLAHGREILALTNHHAALMEQHGQRYADSERARELNKQAADRERERADEATSTLVEVTKALSSVQHYMESQFEAAQEEAIGHGGPAPR